MSSENAKKLAYAIHRKQQKNSGLVDNFEPLDAESSIGLQEQLKQLANKMRAEGLLSKRHFSTLGEAVAETFAIIGQKSDLVFQCYGREGSGFFIGIPSEEVMLDLLRDRWEGVVVVQKRLNLGVFIDVVLDDPLLGDFVEVEWW